jgi:hypothetical protein
VQPYEVLNGVFEGFAAVGRGHKRSIKVEGVELPPIV